MADLATNLIRNTARAFYTTEHVLVIDALITHSTLQDNDLAHVLGMQTKSLRKLCGKLREDGLLSVQSRAERRTDGTASYYGGGPGQGKERMTQRDWYYLNFHRAIDSIKYRMYKLNKHIESLGAPTTEKKDLVCPRCKSQYTELEVLDSMDMSTGLSYCHRCGHALDPVEEDERASENESMKRLNLQLEKMLRLMQQIDASTVPENDFQTALSKQRAVERTDANPAQKTEAVDLPNKNLQSTRGLDIKPEKIAVQLQNDEDVRREAAEAEAQARREKEARQNALPEWIAKSTVSGDITSVGAREEKARREMEAHSSLAKAEDSEDKKTVAGGEEDVMAAYWAELAKAKEQEAADARAEEEEDDDEDDDFEDVDVGGSAPTSKVDGSTNGTALASNGASTGVNTPAQLDSSNATDDEREAKRTKTESTQSTYTAPQPNGVEQRVYEDTPAASDVDEDDELEFENV